MYSGDILFTGKWAYNQRDVNLQYTRQVNRQEFFTRFDLLTQRFISEVLFNPRTVDRVIFQNFRPFVGLFISITFYKSFFWVRY